MNLDVSKEFDFEAYVYYVKNDDLLLWKINDDFSRKSLTDAIKINYNLLRQKSLVIDVLKQKFLQSILFLNRQLTSAEIRYWSIELKMTDIVWVVKKIRYLIKVVIASRVIIVYTDHFVAIDIVHQSSINTIFTEKLNLRLIRAFEYL